MKTNNNYEISNKITHVRLNSFKALYSNNLLKCGETSNERQRQAQTLLNYLCEKFKIRYVSLCVTDKPRPIKSNKAQTYGKYCVQSEKIIIYNTTAKTKKTISIKSFYDTLLHEFIHHYDFAELKLTDSLHTKGFYMRISDLKNKLEQKQ